MFTLDYRLPAIFLQAPVKDSWREGMGDDREKGFGSLNSIFSFPSIKKLGSIDDISFGKLGWMTTFLFGEVWTVLRPNPANSGL